MLTYTEVSRSDGTYFVSQTDDIQRLTQVYQPSEGWELQLVVGEVTPYGFLILGRRGELIRAELKDEPQLIVIFTRNEEDPSPEVKGPFADEAARESWIDDKIQEGWGGTFVCDTMDSP